jgi:hypothetical protein
MAVEIGQLVINARVVAEQKAAASQAGANDSARERQEVVERCVAEVLRVLEDRRER